MKIVQFYHNNTVQLGIAHEDHVRPLAFSGNMTDYITNTELHGGGHEAPSLPIDRLRFAPALPPSSKIIAIGLNYRDHAEESKGQIPKTPIVFAKFPGTLLGHREFITWRSTVTKKVDFEAELAVIIGEKTFECSEEEAMERVFGYTCANDVSARDLQFGDGQWVRGKSLDTFCPLGPWIVTRDEIQDPHDLAIRCILNGKMMQDSSTEGMVFKLPALIGFLSQHFTLLPGDVILTGTPAGVGVFRDPPVYLKDGDVVSVEIEKIGILTNRCRVL
jgi:2-keto-4-pentenoate hydratase/2-oxohepta-3-ene-1,7-dioic acid hydratase in catechol pathway